MTSAPPGWYPDPASSSSAPLLRWWDGTGWTEHLAPVPPPLQVAGTMPVAAHPHVAGPAAPTTPDGVPVAEWGRRFGAWIIDAMITGVVGTLASVWLSISLIRATIDLFEATDPETGELPAGVSVGSFFPDDVWLRVVGVIAISLLFPLLYHVVFLRWWGTTPGKRILNLKVRPWAADGRLGWWTVLQRAGMQYGLFALASVVYLNVLDGLWPLWDDRRQALHDKVASTVVVAVVPDQQVSPGGGQW